MGRFQRQQQRPSGGQDLRRANGPHRGDGSASAAVDAGGVPAERGSIYARWAMPLLEASAIVLACLWIYSPVCSSDWKWDSRFNQFVHRLSPLNGDIPLVRDNGGDWLWDDDQLLTNNPTVQHRVSPDRRAPMEHVRTLAKLWFKPDGADYFPLSYTVLWAQWPFFGMNSPGYHVTTVLLHIAGSLLLWRLLVVMRVPAAWFAAFVFAVHPVCVESVAWVSETKNTLSLVFFLLSAIWYVRADDEAHASGSSGASAGNVWTLSYTLSLVFFMLAMFAKTSVVAMPVVILLHAWWKRGQISVLDVVRSAPFFLVSLVLGIVTIYYQWNGAIGAEKILVGGPLSRIASSGMSVLFYFSKILNPGRLLPIYPRWEVDPPKAWQILFPWPIIIAFASWCWANRGTAGGPKWGRHAIFALGFFLLMVAPVLGFVTISFMRITWAADHFIYLPMIAPLAALAAGAAYLFGRAREVEKPVYIVAAAAIAAALMLSSRNYAGVWVDEDSLWEYTLSINPDAWQAHNRLGAKKLARGDVEAAHEHFVNSTRLRPDLGETHNNLGTTHSTRSQIFAQRGDREAAAREMAAAIEQFTEANRVTPNYPAIKLNLANSLVMGGRFGEAGDQFKEMLEREPDNPGLLVNYGMTLFRQGLKEAAAKQIRRAIEIAPNMKEAKECLAVVLGEKPTAKQAAPTAPAGTETDRRSPSSAPDGASATP